MFDKMKQLMEMKKQADQLKKELEAMRIESDEGSGIKFTVDGSQKFHHVEIDPALLAGQDKAAVEARLLKAINAAIRKAQEKAAEKMKGLAGGLNIPGM